jgi:SAM-dependent methyltransferase
MKQFWGLIITGLTTDRPPGIFGRPRPILDLQVAGLSELRSTLMVFNTMPVRFVKQAPLLLLLALLSLTNIFVTVRQCSNSTYNTSISSDMQSTSDQYSSERGDYGESFRLCDAKRPVSVAELHYDQDYFEWQSRIARTGAPSQAKASQNYIRPGDSVLEIGCGGAFSLALVNAREKYCLEISPTARATHAAGIQSSGTWKDLALILPLGTVDVIYSWDSLEHHPSPIDTLMCARSFLRPGGLIYIVVPFDHAGMGNPNKTMEIYGRGYVPNDVSFHLFTWNPLLLGNLMTAAGFELKSCTDLQVRATQSCTCHLHVCDQINCGNSIF